MGIQKHLLPDRCSTTMSNGQEPIEAKNSAKDGCLPENGDEDSHDIHRQGKAQVLHGAFSMCSCAGCLEDAKKEAEKRFDDDSFAFGYIKKLEGFINHLQLLNGNENDVHHGVRIERSDSAESFASSFGLSHNRPFPPPPGNVIDLDSFEASHDTGLKVEIARLQRWYNRHGEGRIEKDCLVPDKPLAVNLQNAFVLTVLREFDRKKNYWRMALEIISPAFITLLREIAYSSVEIASPDSVFWLKEPFYLLFHNRSQLLCSTKELESANLKAHEVQRDAATQTQTKEHTKLILNFMEHECPDVSKKLDDLQAEDGSGLITFEYAWLLYAPGTVVYSKDNGEYEAFVIESIRGCQKHQPCSNSRNSHSTMELICWSINYDGEVFGRVWSSHYIAPFEGSKEVTSMVLVPEKFLQDRESVRAQLIKRGETFWSLQGQCFREYTGEIWSSRMNEDPIRVIVDHLTYQRRMNWPIEIDQKRGPANAQSKNWREDRFPRRSRHPYNGIHGQLPPVGRHPPPLPNRIIEVEPGDRAFPNDPYVPVSEHERPYQRVPCARPPQAEDASFKKYDSIRPDAEPDLMALLLCPQTVHGYCLRDKVWKILNVTQLQPVNFRKNAWERLVLDEEYKDIVQAMVASYVDKTAGIDDLIAGKGAGLVTLLHGPPGTGKTLTAECVAESFGKPLYQVTCGEIGTHSSALEERLEEIFDDAVTWGAILVLDEADVFLQERNYENLERNALVSVFLRTLEYFNGILFLTTNRVGTFDQAFQSRIHITLGLPILDQSRRIEVWSIFLDELAKSQQLSAEQLNGLQDQVVQTWSRQSLNGRQIRNSVRTALLVAEKKKETVSRKHFDTVLRIGREFEDYMNVLRKGDADVIAEVKGDRLADLGGFQEVDKP